MLERLQKLIAEAGITSRRKAEQLILEGAVTVNGAVVTELGTKADPDQDHIKVGGKLINPALEKNQKVYFLLNKPKGYLSSLSDPKNRPLVTAFLPVNSPRVYPVGRLDFNTEGLLVLTNDGDLADLIMRAGSHCPKIYHVKVKGSPNGEQLERLRRGIKIEGVLHRIAKLVPFSDDRDPNVWFEVTLHEGKNNQIRKMFDEIGHSVMKLRRVAIGHLTDRGLAPGDIRELTPVEVKKFFNLAKVKTSPTKAKVKAKVLKPAVATDTLGKPKPQGKAKTEQAKRLAKTIGKRTGPKARDQASSKASLKSFNERKPRQTRQPRQK